MSHINKNPADSTAFIAGVAGIEPAMTESKSVALTIGRHPTELPQKNAVIKTAKFADKRWGG